MKNFFTPSLFILLVLFIFSSCGLHRSKAVFDQSFDEIENAILVQNPNPNFPLPQIPESITDGQDRAIYLSKHYWEEFPFDNISLINQTEITEQAFVDYIHVLNFIPFKHARRSIKYLFALAQKDEVMYGHFASLFEKYYYTADSPYCNEELYIPVLETILKSEKLTEKDYEKYSFQEEMIHKNRVGSKAANFVYTLENGDWRKMHSIKSNYLILFFATPDCSKCMSVADEIHNSDVLAKVCSLNSFSRTMLCVLNIYPESNIPLWRDSLSSMPQKNWIHAYDKPKVLTNNRVYNLKKLPTIYLLDKNKRIILKDASLEEIESFFLSKE
ncbi:MAG TPA: DUF5106 domain-containing protein [Dysgonamonadaceae bacterium]|nr:DUF5106 domain-containing protein [Dysgonamonadaceae bacterium]